MKAKVIRTGEIVNVYHEPQHGQITNIYKESVLVNGRMWTEEELDFCVKANEAPKKIYLVRTTKIIDEWRKEPSQYGHNIEYVRTDAFIEKALKWYCLDCECNGNCKDSKCFFYDQYKRYLNGETNAIPPKFSDRIINENGSVSEEYRYRHFINRMQDAFIDKALAYLNEKFYFNNLHNAVENNTFHCMEEMFEDFKTYMEGD